jgi:uncharacterized repeat protein (TIGR04076 family)
VKLPIYDERSPANVFRNAQVQDYGAQENHQPGLDEYLDDEYRDTGLCECFEEGEEFVIAPSVVPEEIISRCAWAWSDIRHDMMTIAMGADIPGIRQPGTVITGCTDWLRPVIFKIERMDEDVQ